jgi:hypothetical protein
MSYLPVRDSGRSTNTNKTHVDGHGETSSLLGSIFGSPSVDVSGNYNSTSTNDFSARCTHARAGFDHRAKWGSRRRTVSIGECKTRAYTEGESQDPFESSSREFSNPNKCMRSTFFFYRINKTQ